MNTYGEGMTRRLNLMRAILGAIEIKAAKTMAELVIGFEFGSILPDDLTTLMQNLTTATAQRAIMSQRTAIAHNPLVGDADEELKQIQDEESRELAGTLNLEGDMKQ
jgi:hypothetical protein